MKSKQSKYTLTIITDFSAAHILHGYDGPCSRLHGHNWQVEAKVSAYRLDEIGLAYDFAELKKATRELAKSLDHRFLNEIPPFDKQNPSAENISAWFYNQLEKMITEPSVKIEAITIWENERSKVTYTEEECA